VAIEPSVTSYYDIGSSTKKFRNIWANNFTGDFTGSFTGVLAGSVSGSAGKLASPTVFKMEGDVSAGDGVSFNGQTTTGQVVLQTVINSSLITDKDLAADSQDSDLLLVYRTGTGLLRMPKETFLNHVPVMPVGVIMPYAGSVIPPGYLLCDGSEVRISDYPKLYTVIGYVYKPVGDLIGLSTFGLPDLRGRFPLGRDNMDNGLTVPSKNGLGTILDAGGGPANRVTDVTADTLGTGSGSQSVALAVSNLPDHKHSLNSGNAQYYAGGVPNAGLDTNAIPGVGIATSNTSSGLPNSGGLLSSTSGAAFSTMNPYETINYIIYTGAL
jgi:microcystin-dependent protein